MSGSKTIMCIGNTTIKLTERTIINKELKDLIRSIIEENLEVATSLESMLDPEVRNNVIHEISMFFHKLRHDNHIDQWNIISDLRNNTFEDMHSKGILNFTVKFRQWNCLKPTQLEYVIHRKPIFKKKKKRSRVIK
jgi:hypothetical protein